MKNKSRHQLIRELTTTFNNNVEAMAKAYNKTKEELCKTLKLL